MDARRPGPCARDVEAVSGERPEKALGHLAPGRVVRAEEQHPRAGHPAGPEGRSRRPHEPAEDPDGRRGADDLGTDEARHVDRADPRERTAASRTAVPIASATTRRPRGTAEGAGGPPSRSVGRTWRAGIGGRSEVRYPARGFRARTKALMNFPSTSGAIA